MWFLTSTGSGGIGTREIEASSVATVTSSENNKLKVTLSVSGPLVAFITVAGSQAPQIVA